MTVQCEQVWREVSNYVDGEIDPQLRVAMDEHLRGCKRCTAVVTGTRNVVLLYGDERMMEVPLGFSQRLHHKLDEKMTGRRESALGWMMALGFAALVLVSFEIGHLRQPAATEVRSEQAKYKINIPGDLAVVAVAEGKIFHVPGCAFIHEKDKVEAITAAEALRRGYAPCPRCLKKYLTLGPSTGKDKAETARLAQQEVEQ